MRHRLVNAALDIAGISAIRWRARPAGVYCFNFHRVGNDDGREFHPNLFSCTRARFAEILSFLTREFEVIGLDDLLAQIASGSPPPRPQALITFDDGYADNFEAAYPELQAAKCPAVFFLPTDFIDGNELPWWDRIAWRIAAMGNGELEVPGVDDRVRLSADDLVGSIRRVLRAVKDSSAVPMEDKVRAIEAQVEAPAIGEARRRLFMSWDQVREMHAGGMRFGSHTKTHRILSHLGADVQREELCDSRRIIEERLGAKVLSLAYPVGGLQTYTDETRGIAAACGYQVAFNYVAGVNLRPAKRPFDMQRIEVAGNPTVGALRHRVLAAPQG